MTASPEADPAPAPAARHDRANPRARPALWLFVALAAVLPTLGRFRNGIVSDDMGVIVESDVIHHVRNLPRVFAHRALFVSSSDADTPRRPPVDTYRPLTLATFFWDAALSGTRPTSYHATNLALHALCSLALFALLLRVAPRTNPSVAALGAVFFAVAPHGHEAHVWINGRSDPCCTLWLLLALLARTGPRSSARASGALAVGACYFAALLCKESAALVAPLLVWVPIGVVIRSENEDTKAPSRSPWRRHLAALAVAALAYGALRVFAVERGGINPQPGMLATVLRGVTWFYGLALREALVPDAVCLRLLRDERLAAGLAAHAFGAAALVATGVGVVLARKRAPWVSWGLLFFGLALAPSAVIPALRWIGFGRYLYLPAAGLACALTAALALLPAGRTARIGRAGAALYVAFLAVRLAFAVDQWRNDEALGARAIAENPGGAIGYAYLAVVRETQRRYEEAVGLYLRADELAPWDSSNLVRAATWMLERGDAGRSLASCVTGIRRRDANLAEFHLGAARALTQLGARPELIRSHLVACGAVAFGAGACAVEATVPRRAGP